MEHHRLRELTKGKFDTALTNNYIVFQTAIFSYWLDENGILHVKARDGEAYLENLKKDFAHLKLFLKGKRICVFVDFTDLRFLDKQTMEYLDLEMRNCFKAAALVSHSSYGSKVANLFLLFKPQAFRIQFFWNINEAKEWLKSFRN